MRLWVISNQFKTLRFLVGRSSRAISQQRFLSKYPNLKPEELVKAIPQRWELLDKSARVYSSFSLYSTSPTKGSHEEHGNRINFNRGGDEHAIQIFKDIDEHKFELNEEALEKLLLQNDIRDLPVAVVSIVGAFRRGKSFMLDFFLRYLKHRGDVGWMGKDDQPLDGFAWRGGAERHTSGILLWPEVFKVKVPSGKEIAVLLMDTQGSFDSESTVRDCATIFALSTMLSSVQIYNLSQNIGEDDLQHLRLFTEYGRLALEDCGDTPFQKLQFLVRDWSYPYEAAYGLEGGKEILERRLRVHNTQHDELQTLRKHIRSCFTEISCYLMPHPGLKVATNPTFDGRLSDTEPEFRKQLSEYVPLVLHPNNLLVKKVAGHEVKAHELLHYFKAYSAVHKDGNLPEPKSMFEATAEANNLSAVASSRDMYLNLMEDVCGDAKPYMSDSALALEHDRIKTAALAQFQSVKKMGGKEFSDKYKKSLEEDIDRLFETFRARNESKTLFRSTKMPGTLLKVAGTCYVLSGAFGLVGIDSMANLFNLGVGLTLLGPTAYAYALSFKPTPFSLPATLLNLKQYSPTLTQSSSLSASQNVHSKENAASKIPQSNEQVRDIGNHLYAGAETAWKHVIKPTGGYVVKMAAKGLKTATTGITNKLQQSQKKSN